jgi:F-type H+-transporting ATPase subunit gamma
VQLLPFVDNDIIAGKVNTTAQNSTEYLFEPGIKEVLDILLPRLVEAQIYQAVLESDASEHSARMVAMKNASDAAGEMIEELQYNFNKARQAAITQEIAEIVGGAAALT